MATEDDEWELLLNGNRILVWGNEQIVEMDSGNSYTYYVWIYFSELNP